MKAYICDRCGKVFFPDVNYKINNIIVCKRKSEVQPNETGFLNMNHKNNKHFDLCDCCIDDFHKEFIDGYNSKKDEEELKNEENKAMD